MNDLMKQANRYMTESEINEDSFPTHAEIESAVINADKAFWESIFDSFRDITDPHFNNDELDAVLSKMKDMQIQAVKEWLNANHK